MSDPFVPIPAGPIGQADFLAQLEVVLKAIVATAVVEAIDRSDRQTFDQVGARAFLGLSSSTWFRAKSMGQIPLPVLIGGAERWRRIDLEEWLARLRPSRRRRGKNP